MANPRKFSEKIALHNQKQAEETAAFEAILRDVSAATRPPQKQHLQLSQNITTQYRAGSLPNVNQIANNPGPINLQTALQHLEDIRSGPMTNRMDRVHPGRDRGRPLGPHRKAFPTRTDCSPYGSAYLSPPPDTSWRRLFRHLNGANLSRTNSDSAIHTSAMGPADPMPGPTTPPSHRRIMEMVGQNSLQGGADSLRQAYWDPKKVDLAQSQSRPKSCEVPNINIYPSAEQDHQGIHLPITNSTGSLPDLTVCHFQSPLTTPLDPTEDQNYPQGTPANLSPTSAHHMGMGPPQPPSPQAQSPAQRRRPQHGGPSPLVLSGSPSQQITIAHSPPVSVSNIDPSKIAMDPRLKQQYLLYIQQHRQRGPNLNHTNQSHATHPHVNHVSSNHSGPNPSPQQQHHQQGQTRHTVPQVRITSACDQNESSQCGPPKIWHKQHKPSLSQYRNNVSEANCQSPTSPLSQTSYSPSQSPGLPPSSWNNSPFTDAYQLQQQQQQTNALQHQFEQFNMSQDNHMTTAESTLTSNGISSGIYTSPQNSINFSQAAMHGLTGSQEFHHQPVHFYSQQQTTDILNGVSLNSSPTRVVNQAQLSQHSHLQQPQQQHQQHLSLQTPTGKIPDIVLTDADESFAKELGNAITGFDNDFFPSDEALKVGLDPLDLDGLQMLTDPNMITDPETEQSFKLDRL